MSNLLHLEHLERIKDQLNNTFTLDNLAAFVEKHIPIEGVPWVFGDRYRYQQDVLNETARVVNVQKPAQIGLTMVSMAWGLAACATQPKFNTIYALPSANDATKLVITKMNPLIQGSNELRRLVSSDVDNTGLKQIGGNFLHIRGTLSETAALSISADALIVDEVDRCDQFRIKQFRSRLQASQHRLIRQFSTPTVDGYGIAKEGKTSKRMRHVAKCGCCGYSWLPTYHENIVIPEFTGDLKDLSKENLKDVRWQEARWDCPRCHRDPKLHVSNLEWVCENPSDNYEAVQYFITPVTAHKVLTPDYLVRSSTEYDMRSEWQNQVLGETAQESDAMLTWDDLTAILLTEGVPKSDGVHVMGVDIGQQCAVTVGKQTAEGTVIVVHREFVPLNLLRERRKQLQAEYRIVASVHDTLPETNLIRQITEEDPNAYGAIFSQEKTTEMYSLQEREADNTQAKLNLRQLKINRTIALDMVQDMIKSRTLFMVPSSREYRMQYLSLKRIQTSDEQGMKFSWVKTDGQDHMMFSLMYMLLALRMASRKSWFSEPVKPLVRAFTPRKQQSKRF